MLADLHIYNIETDFALAAKSDFYTPPASVIRLRFSKALFPAVFASPGDALMLLDHNGLETICPLPYFQQVKKKQLTLLDRHGRIFYGEGDTGKLLPGKGAGFRARPWGWNRAIRRVLTKALPALAGVPSDADMLAIERLSHRRTTIAFHTMLDEFEVPLPQEFFNADDAMRMADEYQDLFFKAPWSSSGRGVVRSTEMTREQLRRWIGGYIARQGSVMGEVAWPVALDFASEWECRNGAAEFVGWSVFNASNQGRYMGNRLASQSDLKTLIASAVSVDPDRIVQIQQRAIESLIAPYYSGPLGIDCLATPEGKVNPCVEINIRTTMGHAAIWQLNDKLGAHNEN